MIDIMTPPTAAKDQGGEEVGEEGSLDRSSVQYGMESVESSDEVSPADYHVVEHSPQGRYVRFNAPLGGGTYKEVWKAYDTSEGVEVAWSTLCLQDIPALDKKRIIQEIKTLEKLDHPNIISFYTSWFNREQKQIVFITELMNSGSLLDFVKPVALRWKIVKRWAKQILDGLMHLHAQDPPIIHRNINCDNIFIVANKSQLKIGDLGLSTVAQSENCIGTAPFMAPETFEETNNEKVDIYAFGMTLLQMITKETPYSECDGMGDLYRHISNHIKPEALARIENENARKFIELCISSDPADRPSAEELNKHPFLMENKEEDGLEVVLVGEPTRGGSIDRAEGRPLLRSDTSNDSFVLPSRSGSSKVLDPAHQPQQDDYTAHEQPVSSSKGPAIVAGNGSKLHMRFFSEPPVPSFSEISVSDEESDLECLFSDDGSSASHGESMRSHADDDTLSKSGARSLQQVNHSPRSAWRNEDRAAAEEDDMLCDLPEAESTCKKVKVMGGRNAELEEDGDTRKPASLPMSPLPPKSPRTNKLAASGSSMASPYKAVAPLAVPPRSGASTPVFTSPIKSPPGPASDLPAEAKLPTTPLSRPTPLTTQISNSSESHPLSPPAESRHARLPGSLATVASYDISVRSTSDSSDSSSICSGPASPVKSQTSTPPASPTCGGKPGSTSLGITKETMDVLQTISRQQQRQELRINSTCTTPRNNVMTLVIRTPLLGKLNLVEFEFNLSTDDPQEVAKEMVTELGIPETDMKEMAAHIAMLKEKEVGRRAAKVEARVAPPTPTAIAKPPVPPPAHPQPSTKLPDKKDASPARPMALPGRPERKEAAEATPATAQGGAGAKLAQPALIRRPSSGSLTGMGSAHGRNISGSHMQRLPSEKHLLAHLQQQHHQTQAPSPAQATQQQQPQQAAPPALASIPLPTPVSRSSSSDSLLGKSNSQANPRQFMSASSVGSVFGSNPRAHDTDEELDNLSLAEVETDDSNDEDDDENDEEYQRLKREYLKSRDRCVKVFKQRMESMEQCWQDKEESHRKLLEKHQKAMADFDRRQDVFRNEQTQREVDMEDQWHTTVELHREAVKARKTGV